MILADETFDGTWPFGVVNDTWLRAYGAPFPTKADCVGAIEFPLDVVLKRIVPYVKSGLPLVENLRSKPAMLAVGLKDRAIAPSNR